MFGTIRNPMSLRRSIGLAAFLQGCAAYCGSQVMPMPHRTAAIRIKTKSGTILRLLRARYKPGPMLHKLAAGFEMIGAQIGRV